MSDYQGNIVIKNPATPTGPSAYGSAPGMWKLNEVAYWIKQGLWPNPSIMPDTYWPYTSLLLSSTSLSNANNNLFVDSSGAFNPVSRSGNTTQGSFTPYGSFWSNYFAGAGSYLQTPANSATTIVGTLSNTANLTIECWIFPTAYNSSANFPGLIGDMVATAENNNWSWGITNTGTLMLYWNISGTQYRASTTSTVSLNTWTHIALNVAAGAITMYINGVSQSLTGTTTLGTPSGSNNYLVIGQWNNGSGGTGGTSNGLYTGYISNLRVVKASTYTSNFTPPTSPLTAITSTSLLTCQSNRFIDNSSNALVLTVAGSMAIRKFSPFSSSTYTGISYNQSNITNWSGYFNGSSTYLQAPNNAAFAFGTGDFTVEMWAYFTDTGGTNKPLFDTGVTTNTGRLLIRQGDNASAANVVNVYLSGTTVGSPTFNFNEWTHVAVVRSSGTLKIYINGVGGTGASAAANLTETACILGKFYDVGIYFSGSMSNVRAVKGTAVYTSNFTPPTSPLTAISGTSLLTCQNAAFTDNSTNNFVITQNGNPTVTGNSPFNTTGYWSNYFNGGTDRLQVPVTSNMYLGTTYTIEAWVYYKSNSYGARPIFNEMEPFQGGFAGLSLTMNTSGQFVFEYRPATSGAVTTITGPTVTPNTWYHVAVSNNATSAKMFVNGVQVGSTTTIGDYPSAKTNTVAVGSWGSGWNDGGIPAAAWIGYISNLRVVKGTAVYTSNFTPPTTPLTAISGTVLLTCQNGRFIDNSSVNNTLTPVTTVAAQSFNPFYTSTIASNGGSMYFDGSGDYLSIPALPIFNIGSADACLELWIYPQSTADIVYGGQNGGPYSTIRILQYSGNFAFTINDDTVRSSSIPIVLNQWAHLAVTITGGVARMFVNGVLRFYGTGFGSVNTNSYPYYIGAEEGIANYTNGYMTDYRLSIGAIPTSYQTSSTSTGTTIFTPPTAPLTPTPSTVLLVNGMNAGIYDATVINDMETVGNAQVSTVQSKFGGSSVYFDGSGDALAARPNPVFAFGTSSFTIEAWVNVTSYAGTCAILDTRTAGNEATGVIFYINASGQLSIYNNGTLATSSGSISTGTWTHVAVTRNGTTVTFWINGSSSGTATVSTNFTQQNGYVGTAYNASSNPFYGYMDDLRVTNGVARYTANFTPPTQAFPVY